ncbi:MAG: hypothetical protein M3069_02555 [Chloroflexota bacterium]|nr:hypothetical protein [Chloroflexota bacterium]
MRDPNYPNLPAELEDVDRLFARLDRAPVPEAFTSRVLASTVTRSRRTPAMLAWPWIIAGLAALGLLSLAGYQIGASMAASDGLELLSALLADVSLFTTAPGDVAAALGEVIPWSLVGLGVLGAGLLVLAAGRVAPRAGLPEPTRQIA